MNTTELLQRIDDSMETGKMIMAGHPGENSLGKEADDRVRGFFTDIKDLIETVYGSGNQLSGRFETVEEHGPEGVGEGLTVLADLRKLVVYSGEFSS